MPNKTDWLKVGTAGPTADGRTIQEQWIDESVDIYSLDEYPALIWPYHQRWFDMGKVLDIRADTDSKGRRVMYARLEFDERLREMSRRGTFYSSMEFSDKNFAETGKRALVGLGVTNEPASLGVDQLQFSKRENGLLLSDWQAIESFDVQETSEEENAFRLFAGWARKTFGHNTQQDDDDMKEEDLTRLETAISNGFSKLGDSFDKYFSKQDKDDANNSDAEPPAAAKDTTVDDRFAALEKTVEDKFSVLAEKFDSLAVMPVPGTPVPENMGSMNEEVYT